MKVSAFAFYDAKVGVFHTPFFFLHRGQALRAAQELAQDMSTTIGRHPADFILYEIGLFDDQTGALEAVTPVSLGPVSSFIEQARLPFDTDPLPTIPARPGSNGHAKEV